MANWLLVLIPLTGLLLEVLFGTISSLSSEPQSALAIFMMLWMVLWWVFEIVPLGITALLPIIFMPLLGLVSLKSITAYYSNPVIYLFLGGFMLARALEKTKLNERIALRILRLTGRSDKGIVLGFIVATAFLSMWISNTATTVMMVPIGLSVIAFLEQNMPPEEKKNLKAMSLVLFLSVAYSANIGGIMTPIGTPPNVVFVGHLDELFNREVDFWRWMLIAVPVALSLLCLMFVILNKIYPYKVTITKEFQKFVKEKLKNLGKVDSRQVMTLAIFGTVCFLWVFKGLIHFIAETKFLNDTSVAIFGGLLLFLFPTHIKKWKPVLDSKDIGLLPWNIVLLFGGGMALAGTLEEVGLIEQSTQYFSSFEFSSAFMLVLVLATLTLFLTEIMSNVALCVVALPVIMNIGVAQGIDPMLIGMPAALCASFAFSMPISTPPNAIVFGTNQVKVMQMLRAGLVLNVVGVIVVMSIGWMLMKTLI